MELQLAQKCIHFTNNATAYEETMVNSLRWLNDFVKYIKNYIINGCFRSSQEYICRDNKYFWVLLTILLAWMSVIGFVFRHYQQLHKLFWNCNHPHVHKQ